MKIWVDPSVEKFISGLEESTIAKTLRTIDLLEKFGNQLGMPHSRKISTDIYELRIRGKQEVRIFYCFYIYSICLLHAFLKKSQKIPRKELRHAENKYNSLT